MCRDGLGRRTYGSHTSVSKDMAAGIHHWFLEVCILIWLVVGAGANLAGDIPVVLEVIRVLYSFNSSFDNRRWSVGINMNQ